MESTSKACLTMTLLVLGASACTEPTDLEPTGPIASFEGGTRLRARYEEAGGLRIFRTFYDTARREECAFFESRYPAATTWVDHCLPGQQWIEGFYADPSCNEELIGLPLGVSSSSTVFRDTNNSCDGSPEVYETGPAFPFESAFTRAVDGSCIPTTGDGQNALYRRGDRVPLDAFVSATNQIVPVSGRVAALVLLAADGARLTIAGYDLGLEGPVLPGAAADRTLRWLPTQVAFSSGGYADAACTNPIATKEAHDAACPIRFVIEFVSTGGGVCDSMLLQVHVAGATLAPSNPYYTAENGSCGGATEARADGSQFIVEQKGIMLPGEFAEAPTTWFGKGRLQQMFALSPDGTRVLSRDDLLLDRQLGTTCSFGVAADGSRRCLPPSFQTDATFADAGCTKRLVEIDEGDNCGGSWPPAAVSLPVPGQPYPQAFHTGAEVTPAVVYYDADGVCTEGNPLGSRWFEVGAEIAPSALAPIAERTD